MHIGFLVFDPLRKCAGCSAIRMRALSLLFGAQKNDLRGMRTKPFRVVRSQVSRRSRSSGRRLAHIPGVRGTARRVPPVRQGEARASGVLGEQPALHQAVCFYVGRRCRSSPIRDVAQELKLDWHTVKELDKQYMRAQLAKAGTPAPTVIRIDEISVLNGHEYRIVVSDLIRGRPIWFGGDDRSEA